MTSGEYEVVGVAPAGAAYLFTNDKNINSVSKMSGKKVAVLDFDKAQPIMVASIGASPVNATIATFGPMFNNGSVDIIAAPAMVFAAPYRGRRSIVEDHQIIAVNHLVTVRVA